MSILSNQALAALFRNAPAQRPAGDILTDNELRDRASVPAVGILRILGIPSGTPVVVTPVSDAGMGTPVTIPFVPNARWSEALRRDTANPYLTIPWTGAWQDSDPASGAYLVRLPGGLYFVQMGDRSFTATLPAGRRIDVEFANPRADYAPLEGRGDAPEANLGGGVGQGIDANGPPANPWGSDLVGFLRIAGLPASMPDAATITVNGQPVSGHWQDGTPNSGHWIVPAPRGPVRVVVSRNDDGGSQVWEAAEVAAPGTPEHVPTALWFNPTPRIPVFAPALPKTPLTAADPVLGAPGQFAGMTGQVSVSGLAESDAVTVDGAVPQSVWDSGVRRFSVPAGKRWIRARGQEQQVEVVPGADTPVAFAMSPEAGVDRVATVSFANVPPTFTVGVWDGAQWQVVAGATARLDAGQHRFRTTDAVRVDGAPAPQNPLSAVVEQNVTGTATVDFGPAVLAALRALHEGAIVPVNVPSGASLTIAFRQVAPVTDGQTRTVIMPAEPATPYRLTRLTPGGYELVAEVGTDRRVLHVDVREGELTRADFSQAAMAPQRGTLMVTGLPPANGARRQLSVQDVMGSVTPYVVGESPALIVGTAPSDALTLSLPVGAYRIAVDDYNAAGVGANVLPWQPVTVTAGAPTVVTWRLAGGGSDGSAATAMGDVAVTGIPQGASVVITPVPPDGRWARPPVLGVNGAARIDGVPAGPALVTAMTAQGQEIRSAPITVTVGVTSVNVATGLAIGATDQNPSPSVSISPLRTLPDGRRAGRLVPATETFAQEWFRRFGAPLFQPGTGDREWAEFDVLPITDAVRAALPADQAIYAVYSAQDGGLIPSLLSRTQYDQLRAAFAGERGTATAEDAASQNAARYRRYAAIAAVVGVGSLAVGALAWFFGGGEDD